MNAIRELTGWIKAHKPTAIFFAVIFAGIAVYAGLDHIPLKWGISIYAFVILCWLLVYNMDRKDVSLILILTLLAGTLPAKAEPVPDQPQAGGAGVAVVVIVVGGVAVYLLVKTCQRLFPKAPKPDPSTNEVFFAVAPASDDYAASWTYSSYGSCYLPGEFRAASVPAGPPVLMEITMQVDWTGQASAQIAPINPEDNYTELAGFKNLLTANGLTFYDHGFGQKSFGKNGRPATEAEVPIRFDDGTYTVDLSNGGPSSTLILERSFDLITWEPIHRTKVGYGQSLRFRDLTLTSQAFYRVSTL